MELLQKLAETPLPQIFIIAGIFFLILSVVNKFGGKLDINPKRQGQAILIGVVLILVGLLIYLQPSEFNSSDGLKEEDTPTVEQDVFNEVETEDKYFISIYSVNKKEFEIQEVICRFHISKGFPCDEDANWHIQNTQFSIRIDNRELEPVSKIDQMQDHNGCHVQQFYEFRLDEPGRRYKIEAKTMEMNGPLVDSRIFYIIRK